MTLHRIESAHFVAGVSAENDVITVTAPILHYMLGWTVVYAERYCAKKGWRFKTVLHGAQDEAKQDQG